MSEDRQSQFARLFSENHAGIYGYIYALVPRAADAEEVLGRVTVLLWEKWDEFEPGTNFRAWARRIAYNVAMNYLRRHERREQHLSDATLASLADDADAGDYWLRVRALAHCVDQLPPEQRRLIEMCYSAGATVANVAKKLGKTIASVYKSRSRIRQNLHKCVEKVLAEEEIL